MGPAQDHHGSQSGRNAMCGKEMAHEGSENEIEISASNNLKSYVRDCQKRLPRFGDSYWLVERIYTDSLVEYVSGIDDEYLRNRSLFL